MWCFVEVGVGISGVGMGKHTARKEAVFGEDGYRIYKEDGDYNSISICSREIPGPGAFRARDVTFSRGRLRGS